MIDQDYDGRGQTWKETMEIWWNMAVPRCFPHRFLQQNLDPLRGGHLTPPHGSPWPWPWLLHPVPNPGSTPPGQIIILPPGRRSGRSPANAQALWTEQFHSQRVKRWYAFLWCSSSIASKIASQNAGWTCFNPCLTILTLTIKDMGHDW